MKTRGTANLLQNMATLNDIIKGGTLTTNSDADTKTK
jgi:hypothetical protein